MADPIERAAGVVRNVDGLTSLDFHQEARARFLRAVEEPPPQRLKWAAGFAALAAAGAAALVLFGAPLTYSIEGAPAHDGAWVRAGEVPAVLRFSDGTVLELKAGTQAEVVSTDARGAVVRVSSGVLHAQVVHTRTSRWAVQTGPYTVHVTGTRFSAGRSGDDQIDVELFEGSIEVSGPGLMAPLKLKAGQRFHASLEQAGARVEVSSASEPRVEPPATAAPKPSVVRPAVAPAKAAPPARVSWRTQVAAGAFAEVLAAARAEGIDKALLRDADEVFALGEAARYLKEDVLAKRSFEEVRRRSPKSVEAANAALLLGRMAEQRERWDEASSWYERCEADGVPSLLPEALGRRILTLERLGQREQARAAARRYLEVDPSGPWAAVARRTLE